MPKTPLLLAFDTSAAHCAAALLSGDQIIASVEEPMNKGQGERLLGLCAEVLASADVTYSDLTAIGVGIGPGNFTGIRIAVSAARGLALGLGVPAIGVSHLQALAFGHDLVLETLFQVLEVIIQVTHSQVTLLIRLTAAPAGRGGNTPNNEEKRHYQSDNLGEKHAVFR